MFGIKAVQQGSARTGGILSARFFALDEAQADSARSSSAQSIAEFFIERLQFD
jgi:hypothetical protein